MLTRVNFPTFATADPLYGGLIRFPLPEITPEPACGELNRGRFVALWQVVEVINPQTNTTKLARERTWFGSLSAYKIGYKYANQTLFTFLPLLLLLVFNSLLVRQVIHLSLIHI